jgi:hypothetical protein
MGRLNNKVADFGLVKQVRVAANPRNRLATFIGLVFGGFVPVATYTLAHNEVATNPFMWFMVVGGLMFSAMTVFGWARTALHHPAKAAGFVLLTEGVMTFSHTDGLSIVALILLVLINGLATGCRLVVNEGNHSNRKRVELGRYRPGAGLQLAS